MKVDIRKAYDSIEGDFLHVVFQSLCFSSMSIQRILECVTTSTFSVCINGEFEGFFPSSRGLRQGNPLSPYLFVIVMEVFLGLLGRMSQSPSFGYHWKSHGRIIEVVLCG